MKGTESQYSMEACKVDDMKQICGNCIHLMACAAWNVGSLYNTDASSCCNYKSITVARWIDTKYIQWPANEIRSCSACGWAIHKNHLRQKDLAWRFCPACGATMEVTDD